MKKLLLIPVIALVALVMVLPFVGASNTTTTVNASTQQLVLEPWAQPHFNSPQNEHGIVLASGYDTVANRPGWGAFDGWYGRVGGGDALGLAAQWTKPAASGWVELRLNYDIVVTNLRFVQRSTTTETALTRDAYFTGSNGVALGAPFVAPNFSRGVLDIPVDSVRTNIIRLNVTSSFGNTIGANEIFITAQRVVGYGNFPGETTNNDNSIGTVEIVLASVGALAVVGLGAVVISRVAPKKQTRTRRRL